MIMKLNINDRAALAIKNKTKRVEIRANKENSEHDYSKLKENDIIAMRTGYPGVACLVPKKYEGCQTFTTLIVRLKKDNNPSYVCSYINSDLGKRFIDSEKVGVAQQNVGAKSLAKMPIKIAPKQLQDEYADFVKQVDKSKVIKLYTFVCLLYTAVYRASIRYNSNSGGLYHD